MAAAEDSTFTLTITSAGMDPFSQEITRDCDVPEPSVGAIDTCAAGGITVQLINGGDDDAVFTVQGVDVPVAANTTVTHPVAAAEDSTFTLTITSAGMDPFSQEITRNCDLPDPSVGTINACAAGGISVQLINDGDDDVVFTVNGVDVPVGPDTTLTHVVTAAEDSTTPLAITAPGMDPFNQDVTRNCDEPDPSVGAVNECATGGITVGLVNGGADEATFTVNGTDVTVPANQTVTHPVAVDEDSTITLTITSAGMDPFSQQITRDCLTPNPRVTDDPVCAAGGIAMNLNNENGTDEAVFTVNGIDITVPAGEIVQHLITVAEDATIHITVTSGAQLVFDQDVTRNCVEPAASIVHTCTTTGTTITLTNPGSESIDLTIIRNGNTVETVTLAAGSTVQRSYTMAEDETSRFRVTGPNFDSGVQNITRDCVEVLGTRITRSSTGATSLARTGVMTAELVMAGLLLVSVGALLLVGSRRRTAA